MKINVVKLVLLLNWSSIFVGKSILILYYLYDGFLILFAMNIDYADI